MQNKNNKILNILYSRVKMYFIIIVLLLIFISAIFPELILLNTTMLIIIIIYSYFIQKRNEKELQENTGRLTLNVEKVTKEVLNNSTLPIVLIEQDGKIIYENTKFKEIFLGQNKTEYISQMLNELRQEKGNYISKETKINNLTYCIMGSFTSGTYVLYFVDQTKYYELNEKYQKEQNTVGIIMIDNYDEVITSIPNEHRPEAIANIEKKLYEWSSPTNGLIIKMEKDRFVYIFARENMIAFEENKFSILDEIKEVEIQSRIPVTLSIGLSLEYSSYYEQYKAASSALEIALGRGGDQVVIKRNNQYEFFGGRTQEVEKRTKVKARIVAYALNELINEAENVIIMGHTNPDVDVIGSALGLYRLAKIQDKQANIVLNSSEPTLEGFMKSIEKESEYENVFIDKNEALQRITKQTLLIIVDTNRRSYVESQQLLDETDKIVLIDHHRRTAEFIENSILMFHEVYASSSAELVTEIISYSGEDAILSELEAEALYSGIMIDTKNFTFKTGVRTFEAAAFLKKSGIDIIRIKQWFETDLETYNTIAAIVKDAELMATELANGEIAISICTSKEEKAGLIAAKSADEILTISGIVASFVLYESKEMVGICGRSVGDINVQLILEKLGGGGHITVAGAQLCDVTMEQAKEALENAIQEYLKEGTN